MSQVENLKFPKFKRGSNLKEEEHEEVLVIYKTTFLEIFRSWLYKILSNLISAGSLLN